MRDKGLIALKYKVIILDEVHERSVESDLLLACVKLLMMKNKDMRLVPCSVFPFLKFPIVVNTLIFQWKVGLAHILHYGLCSIAWFLMLGTRFIFIKCVETWSDLTLVCVSGAMLIQCLKTTISSYMLLFLHKQMVALSWDIWYVIWKIHGLLF